VSVDHKLRSVAVLVLGLLLWPGCLTRRQAALLGRQPTNRVFDPATIDPLSGGETHRFGEFDAGDTQNVCLLQLAPDAKLGRRYHRRHDVTLHIAAGSAIVVVEETRYFVGVGSAVIIPRYTAYEILPHRTAEDLAVLMVFSPPFDGRDSVLED
jgi:mannose-6-phosphate isomerase-like protein (cupin superfamily)